MLEQWDRDPAGRPQGLPGLGGGERLGKLREKSRRLGFGVGRQHDVLGDPQQQPSPSGRRDRPGIQAEFAQPPRLRGHEGLAGEVGEHRPHPGQDVRRQRGLRLPGWTWLMRLRRFRGSLGFLGFLGWSFIASGQA